MLAYFTGADRGQRWSAYYADQKTGRSALAAISRDKSAFPTGRVDGRDGVSAKERTVSAVFGAVYEMQFLGRKREKVRFRRFLPVFYGGAKTERTRIAKAVRRDSEPYRRCKDPANQMQGCASLGKGILKNIFTTL